MISARDYLIWMSSSVGAFSGSENLHLRMRLASRKLRTEWAASESARSPRFLFLLHAATLKFHFVHSIFFSWWFFEYFYVQELGLFPSVSRISINIRFFFLGLARIDKCVTVSNTDFCQFHFLACSSLCESKGTNLEMRVCNNHLLPQNLSS